MFDKNLDVVRAFTIAAHAGIGQLDKATGERYSTHPERVVYLLQLAGFDPEFNYPLLAAAYLHDVLEDTKVSRELLEELFGEEVALLVVGLTDVYTHTAFPDLNRVARKKLEHARLAAASQMVQTVKCADIADNARRLGSYPDREFARKYVHELDDLLAVLTGANADVMLMARNAVARGRAAIGM